MGWKSCCPCDILTKIEVIHHRPLHPGCLAKPHHTNGSALQTVQDGRQFLKYVDPRLGVPLPERDYGGNCLIYDADNKTDPFHNIWVGVFSTVGFSSPGLPLVSWGQAGCPRSCFSSDSYRAE